MGRKKLVNKTGSATFVVNIQCRQHHTWQGAITWAEQKKIRHFRSELEMVKLMAEAEPLDGSDRIE